MENEKDIKNTVLPHIIPPERGDLAMHNAWIAASPQLSNILSGYEDNTKLSDNVFLLHLPEALPTLSAAVNLLQSQQFSYQVLYFAGEPQWTFES
ncbi:MAG: hypothetical protein GX654_05455 [Desulfatiglans sp.]|jgi:hypothetical protein|nr:hypothetical protein [Desulfatiglans sp.]